MDRWVGWERGENYDGARCLGEHRERVFKHISINPHIRLPVYVFFLLSGSLLCVFSLTCSPFVKALGTISPFVIFSFSASSPGRVPRKAVASPSEASPSSGEPFFLRIPAGLCGDVCWGAKGDSPVLKNCGAPRGGVGGRTGPVLGDTGPGREKKRMKKHVSI